ncbi:putative coil containing protein [Vibrio phage 466E53-1]|nr:putative coil containing protein [Vibrio phage 466E53-1]
MVACWNNVTGGHPTVGCWLVYADRIKEECRELTLSDLKPRTKTEFVKCDYGGKVSNIVMDFENNVPLYKLVNDEHWTIDELDDLFQLILNDCYIYRKVEVEIDERQEFVDRMLEMLDFNEAYDGNKIVSDMYDNFGFRFKLMEK